MMVEGVGAAKVQRGGNMAYQSLDAKEREIYQKRADDANSNSGQVKESAGFSYQTGPKNCFQHTCKCKHTVIEHVEISMTCL